MCGNNTSVSDELCNGGQFMIKNRYPNNRNLSLCFLIFVGMLLLCGCKSQSDDDTKKTEESDTFVYYIDKNRTKLVAEPFKPNRFN